MRTVLLYGPPGVGKLTVGTELAALTGFKLVHNHLSANLASSVFPFGTWPWGRLLRQLRRAVHAEAARENIDIIITGAVFSNIRAETEFWSSVIEPIAEHGGTVLYVQLTCDRDELFSRVQNESRRQHHKLMDPQVLKAVSAYSDLFAAMPFEPLLRLDITHLPPADSARQIADHYDLPIPPTPTRTADTG